MKITAEHIGKKVKISAACLNPMQNAISAFQVYKVCYVGEKDFMDEAGLFWPLVLANGDWAIVEETKPVMKPSERMIELLKYGSFEQAMLLYLDEVLSPLLEKK